jgi:hypothetical protein
MTNVALQHVENFWEWYRYMGFGRGRTHRIWYRQIRFCIGSETVQGKSLAQPAMKNPEENSNLRGVSWVSRCYRCGVVGVS